jgi:HEAT repeat protein
MPRLAFLLPLVLVALLMVAPPASTQPLADNADDEKLLKDAGYKLDAPDLVEFFRKRTFSADDQQRAAKLAGQLGDEQYEVRQNASQELIKLGPLARPYLLEALRNKDAEVKRRAQDCLDAIDGGPEPGLVSAAARLLATKSQTGTAAVVMNYLHWTPNDDVHEDVLLALLKIVEREGKIDPVVSAALTDKSAARRAAAALAIGRSGSAEQRKDVRKLLADPDTKVRLRAAQGLLAGRDKDAIPTLIELLAKAEFASLAEDLLGRIAGDKAPKVTLGETDESRRQCREAWEAWWKANGDKVTLERVEVDPLVYDAPRRATDLATRWTAALMKGDTVAIRRLTSYPFSFVSQEEYNAEQLDMWVKGIPQGRLTFKDPRLVDGPRFLKSATPAERKRLGGIPPRDLYAVCFTFREGGAKDQLYVIVRFKAGEARVLGLGLGDLK